MEKDFHLRSLADLGTFARHNKLLSGTVVAGVLGILLGRVVKDPVLKHFFPSQPSNEMMGAKETCEAYDEFLRETTRTLGELQQSIEDRNNKYHPCSKEIGRELRTARMWVRDHLTELFVDLVPNCKAYLDCPLKGDTTQFSRDFIDSLFTAQFFCPPFDRVGEEGATVMASTPRDHDASLEVQVFLHPWNFEPEQASLCILVHDVVHELIHATTGFEHGDLIDKDKLDWAYAMGYEAYYLCTRNPPEEWIGSE